MTIRERFLCEIWECGIFWWYQRVSHKNFLIHQFVKVFFYESFALYGSPVMLALVPNLVCSDEMNSAEHGEIQGKGFIVL